MEKVVLLSGSNSRNSGGLFNSVKSLAFSLIRNSSSEVAIVSYDDKFSNEDRHTYKFIKLFIYKLTGPKQLGFSLNLSRIVKSVKPSVIHQQGIWMLYSRNVRSYKRGNKNAKIIISPRGMLDPWILKNGKWKKEIAKFFYENSNLKNADCIHALCYSEYKSIRAFGLKNPVAIIPNGIDLPKEMLKSSKIDKDKKTLLFISRIHPKKGLKFLIEVLRLVKEKNPIILDTWVLRIAGWSQVGHQEELIEKCKEYGLMGVIEFVGPVYGLEKENELKNADAFILPSYSEGLPMSILEAWSYKLPVVMTKECNLPEGFAENAAVLINHEYDGTVDILSNFLNLKTDELITIGENGYKLVKKKFTWDIIGLNTIQLYNWLKNKNTDKPDFIYLE